MKQKLLAVLMAIGFAFGASACISTSADQMKNEICEADPSADVCVHGIPAATRFFAIYGDYVRVKGAAVAYVEAPSTPQSHREIIAAAVLEADAVVREVRAAQRAGEGGDVYIQSSQMLRAAIITINARIAAGAAADAVGR